MSYGPQTAGVANNLLPVSSTTGAGDGLLSAVTAVVYDSVGNLLTVDGPLTGTADTTRYRYSAVRELLGTVSADPDGAGALKPRAQRYTYNADGLPTLVEAGTVNSQSDTDWAAFATLTQKATTYDAGRRKVKDVTSVGATTVNVAQYSYDALGRPVCTALRMDPAQWGSQTNACLPQTTATIGPDRILKLAYDAGGQVTSQIDAFGTTAARTTKTLTYSSNGKLATLADGKGNLTTYVYDGFDRLSQTRYPSPTTPSTSSTTDYEQLTYDAASRLTADRKRNGQTIGFTYDALGRIASKVQPNSALSVFYSYDNFNNMTQAAYQSIGGTSRVDVTYDALGRVTSNTTNGRNLQYQYDIAGRRTRMTWPDGNYVNYDYDVLGEVTNVRENGAASGVGVLATYAYDNYGRRTAITRGNSTTTSYGYDPASRLSTLTQDLAGANTASDLTITLAGYNPAGQIGSKNRSNTLYSWQQAYNVNRNYTANGLNQLTTSGAVTLSYDGKGNLASDDTWSYGYDTENRMQSAVSSGTTLTIGSDPLGRLAQTSGGASGDTRFTYDGSNLAAEYDGTSGTMLRRYVFGPGDDEALVWYEGSTMTDRRFLHTDDQGSIIAATDSSGAVLNTMRYNEYGIGEASQYGRFGYTGQAWLPDAGLYWYKARVYSAQLGRFFQSDPIGYDDGPNWYNYVGSDPVNGRDPSGLAEDEIGVLASRISNTGYGANLPIYNYNLSFSAISIAMVEADRAQEWNQKLEAIALDAALPQNQIVVTASRKLANITSTAINVPLNSFKFLISSIQAPGNAANDNNPDYFKMCSAAFNRCRYNNPYVDERDKLDFQRACFFAYNRCTFHAEAGNPNIIVFPDDSVVDLSAGRYTPAPIKRR